MTNYKLILLLLLIGCNTNEKQEPESTQAANQTHTITQIQLTRAQSVQANIKTGEIGQRLLPSKLETTSEITIDKINTATVSAFSDGIITKLFAQQNQLVQKGSVLATIQKPDLVDLQQQYLANQDRLDFLKTEYERYQSLKEADATATKNYLKAEAEWKAAITIQKTIAAKLRQFHIDPSLLTADNIITEINLKAPISGTISKVLANIGTSLSPGTPVYELTDYKQLHPVLYVFEKDLFNVQKGQTVELILPGEEQKTFQATIYSIERLVDPERKTVKVHARFTTSIPDQLAVGAYLEGKIWINNKKTVPALPKEAIIREDQSNYIFILEKEDDSALYFRKVKVKLGASDANFTAITPEESLPETAKVVLNGAYYISAQGAGLSAEE
jgi:cobalt-zinc-cadmium efflux system membrane fusion protein